MTTTLHLGDCRDVLPTLPDQSVHCCVTSPPYFGLRDYGQAAQIGLEPTPDEFVGELVKVFREVRRVLRDDGTLWLNIGDSYARAGGWSHNCGLDGVPRGESGRAITCIAANGGKSQKLAEGCKPKDLIGIPWMLAFALRADGWYLRQDIIWSKPNPMPESVTDRCTKAHEYIFLLSKSARYYYDGEAIKEHAITDDRPRSSWEDRKRLEPTRRADPSASGHVTRTATLASESGRNRRSVWTVATQPYSGAHFATFPQKLIEPCILAGCPVGGTVLDPFNGSGTTCEVAIGNARNYVGIELSPEYMRLAEQRLNGAQIGMPLWDAKAEPMR
jgi:DNA modification methylase